MGSRFGYSHPDQTDHLDKYSNNSSKSSDHENHYSYIYSQRMTIVLAQAIDFVPLVVALLLAERLLAHSTELIHCKHKRFVLAN